MVVDKEAEARQRGWLVGASGGQFESELDPRCRRMEQRGKGIVYSCRLNSAWVRSRTKLILKFFGGSMSLMGFDFERLADLEGWRAWEMVGNGRSARDVAKPGLRLGLNAGRGAELVAGPLAAAARGEETRGRDIDVAGRESAEWAGNWRGDAPIVWWGRERPGAGI